MPYCVRTGLSKPYSCTSCAWRAASMPRSPAIVSMGSPGTSRTRKKASSVIPMKVGMMRARRVRRKRNTSGRTSFLVAQLATQDLAHRCLRHLGAELDHPRLLVACEVRAAVVAHLLFGELRVLLHDHELHRFAGLLVGHADHSAFQNA